jgi:hypothetical protein
VGDIDTVLVDSLKALDPERPIREEADMAKANLHVRFGPIADIGEIFDSWSGVRKVAFRRIEDGSAETYCLIVRF